MSLRTIITSVALASLLLISTSASASSQHQGHITPEAASINLTHAEATPKAPSPGFDASQLSVNVLGLSLATIALTGVGAYWLAHRQQLAYRTS